MPRRDCGALSRCSEKRATRDDATRGEESVRCTVTYYAHVAILSAIQQRRDFVPIVMMLLRARFKRPTFDHRANLGGGGGGGAPLGGNPGGNAPGGGGAAYPP